MQPPGEGAFWDVFVTTTNEPDHFVVVPLAEIRKLNDLIENLHSEYEVWLLSTDRWLLYSLISMELNHDA